MRLSSATSRAVVNSFKDVVSRSIESANAGMACVARSSVAALSEHIAASLLWLRDRLMVSGMESMSERRSGIMRRL